MKTIKQISLWFFALMAITSVTNGVWAADFTDGTLFYEILSATEVAVYPENGSSPFYNAGNAPAGNITIPATVINGGTTYNVTAIGENAFSDCDALTSVTIPSSVTAIGDYAFYYCTALTSVTIPAGVTTIGDYAFYYCTALTSVTILVSVTTIGDYAFAHCPSLTSVTIPSSVTTIGDEAFFDCTALTSVTIPASVTAIGVAPFAGCTALTAITVDAGNTAYASEGGVLYDNAKTTLIQYPEGKTGTSFTIPSSVTTIGEAAFSDCDALTSVIIPASVTTIGDEAFAGCTALTSVTIPSSVTTIGDEAFYYCPALTSITIPSSVTAIEDWAFYDCTALTSVTVNWTTAAAIPAIDPNVFDNVTLSGVTLSVPTGTKSLYEGKPESFARRPLRLRPVR